MLAQATERRIGDFNVPNLANAAWAFLTAAKRRIGDFNVQDLANTAWAFAKAGIPIAVLFEVVTHWSSPTQPRRLRKRVSHMQIYMKRWSRHPSVALGTSSCRA